MKLIAHAALTLLLCTFVGAEAFAQRGPSGRGGGRGPNRADPRHNADRDVFHFLLNHHDQIERSVKLLPNGVETVTESRKPEVAAKIKDHVQWMAHRIRNGQPIRMRDPLFAEIFRFAAEINIVHEPTETGVRVIETSDDPHVVKLIQAHAQVVSKFVERGFAEAMKNHRAPHVPAVETSRLVHPAIANYGGMAPMPSAAQQPRPGAKLVVDLTTGGQPDSLNPAIDRAARFLNIYHGAGEKPAHLQMAVVMHGPATPAALSSDAYAIRFGTRNNPNLDCLHELHEAGAEIYVCGQSLVHAGLKSEDVAVFVDVAVSAATALANLQADGYAYIPLTK